VETFLYIHKSEGSIYELSYSDIELGGKIGLKALIPLGAK